MLHSRSTINCKGRLLVMDIPVVMGILNLTPDSFYDGGRLKSDRMILDRAQEMLEEGASILDLGGMSTRPGAAVVPEEEELRRVIPVVELLQHHFPEAVLSVDTVKSVVAREAYQAGAHIINDISAGRMDERMYETVAALQAPYVLMHMKGTPQNMQVDPSYEDVVLEVLDFFIRETGRLRELGIKDIVIDVGFGFGKNLSHNYALLKKLHVFQILELPVLTGISRKSMVCRPLGSSPEEALNGTTALHMVALQQGSKILRVHDVRPAMEVIRVWQQLEKA